MLTLCVFDLFEENIRMAMIKKNTAFAHRLVVFSCYPVPEHSRFISSTLGSFVIVLWLTHVLHCHPAFNLPDINSIISSHYDTVLLLI